MSRVLIAAVAALLVVALAVGGWWLLREDGHETIVVERGSIDVTIQTIGWVQSTGSTPVRSQVQGEVAIVAVRPGDVVRQDDILVELVTEPLDRAVENAERQLEEAEFALQEAERQADEQPDDETRRFAVVQAGQRVDAAEVALDDARRAQTNALLLAPRDGIVLETPVQAGDLINRSTPVAIIFSRDDLEVIANVDELDLANVQSGAEATLRLDAYPDREISGQVDSTAPAAREQGGATVFSTVIAIDIPDDLDIRPGMNADVTIVTEARDNVLLIPQRAIRTVGNRAFVDVLSNGDSEEREIVLGYRSAGQAEVVSGLQEGDEVVLP